MSVIDIWGGRSRNAARESLSLDDGAPIPGFLLRQDGVSSIDALAREAAVIRDAEADAFKFTEEFMEQRREERLSAVMAELDLDAVDVLKRMFRDLTYAQMKAVATEVRAGVDITEDRNLADAFEVWAANGGVDQ